MNPPFEGIRVIDATHVLAGPFAAYQLAAARRRRHQGGAPGEPDQSRDSGADRRSTARGMGTMFLTQGSNKRAITLDLKQEAGQEVMRRLLAGADVLVENYRPGAFEALGLGPEAVSAINPRLVYCSISAFGQGGPRARADRLRPRHPGDLRHHGRDRHAGGEPDQARRAGDRLRDRHHGRLRPRRGAVPARAHRPRPAHRPRHAGRGDDDAGLAPHRLHAHRQGPAAARQRARLRHQQRLPDEGRPLVMLGASNLRQQRRLWAALGRPEMAKGDNEASGSTRATRKPRRCAEIMQTRTADEWEAYLQARHVPAGRVRTMAEALADPHLATRAVLHRHDAAPGVDGPSACRSPPSACAWRPARETAPPRSARTPTRCWRNRLREQDIAALRTAGDI